MHIPQPAKLSRIAFHSLIPLLTTVLLICLGLPSLGQGPVHLGASEQGRSSLWVLLGEQSGLPSIRVRDVAQDAGGQLWVITEAGLAIFDSYRFQTPNGDTVGLGQSGARFVTTVGRELLLHDNQRVYRCEGDTVTEIDWAGGRDDIKCVGLSSDPSGGFVVLTRTGDGHAEARRWHDPGEAMLDMPIELVPTESPIRSMVDGCMSGPILVADNGLYQLRGNNWYCLQETSVAWQVHSGVTSTSGRHFLSVLYPHHATGIWNITDEGIQRNSAASFQPNIDVMRSSSGEALGVRTTGHIVRLDSEPASLWMDPPPDLDLATCTTILSDGTVVVGSHDGVFLMRADKPAWTRQVFLGGRGRVADVHRARDGSLWIATNHGLARQRTVDDEFEWIDEVLGKNLWGLTSVAEDADGNIWTTSGAGFVGALRWDGEEWTHFGPEQGLPAPVHRTELDREGRLWFLCLNGNPSPFSQDGPGPLFWDGSQVQRFSDEEPLPSGRMYCFDQAPNGDLWFGHSGGLSRWHEGEWTHWSDHSHQHMLNHPRVFSIAIDAAGKVYFSHQKDGLGWLNEDGSASYLGPTDGLVGDEIWELQFDARGWLWASTQNGLALLRDGELIPFDRSTGLHTRSLWPILAEEDRVTIGSIGRGLAILHLDSIEMAPPRLLVYGPHRTGDQFEVSWQAFDANAARSPGSIETRRRLDDEPWSRWSLQRTWTAASIAEGEHTIEIQARAMLGQIVAEHKTITIPTTFWRRSIVLVPAFFFLSAIGLGISIQQSRKRRLHSKVRISEERYRDLVENAGLPIYTHDLNGKLLDLNRSAEQVLSVDRISARGRALDDFVPEDQRGELKQHLQSVANGTAIPNSYELTFEGSTGSIRVFEVHTRLIQRDGRVRGLQSVGFEITNRKELEDELAQSRKMEAIGQLAGGIAHDFNNVLLVVNGHCELLLDELPSTSPHAESVGAILHAGQRAASLTRELLAYSRKQVLRPERIDLNRLLRDMAQSLLRLLGEDIRLEMRLCEQDTIVRADPGQVQQVILNLGLNARDAMPLGGELTIRTQLKDPREPNSSKGPNEAEWVELAIHDTGHGMDETTRKRIFDPFFTTKGPGKGTGLGLASVYGIVQQSGGFIQVQSTPNEGSIFQIFLRQENGTPLEAVDITQSLPIDLVRNISILLVEDEDQVRLLLAQSLESAGFDVVEAKDGAQALELAGASDKNFEIIVTDVVMPNMSGPELVRKLESTGLSPGIIFVSGYSGDALERYGGVHGVHHHMQKPFRSSELLELVHELLSSPRVRSAPEQLR
ncbi:MAG: PAS domain S-box-containing protein [Planctomycetota bacterium]|jgi:PAS domain S-box-containing protein